MIKGLIQDLIDEIKGFKTSKVWDALIPTITFILASRIVNNIIAIALAIIIALAIGLFRKTKGDQWLYAIAGLFGVAIAVSGVLLSGQSKGYFLSAMINSILYLFVAIISLISRRPLAMWLSKMSHGWPIEWYQRSDIRPAYVEVTMIWSALLIIRLFLQVRLFSGDSFIQIAVMNTLLSTPVTLIVMVISYIYGIIRLKQLTGPSVKEYQEHAPKPWKSQTKGF